MSILDRIRRIAKANIDRLLDRAENPEEELQAKVKELEEVIAEGKAAAGTYGATFRRMEAQADELQARQAELASQAQAAVAIGEEATARRLLNEKLTVTERIGRLKPGLDEGRKTYDQLRRNLAHLQDQLRAARVKLAELRARQRSAVARQAMANQVDTAAGLGAGGPMFDRMEDDVMQVEACAEVAEDIAGDDLEVRARELQIEAELTALKERAEEGET